MTGTPWDAQGKAQAALRTIAADPRYGPAALSNAQTMTTLLKDMLPDAPRESSVLVAASEVGVPGMLHSYVSRGMDLATASRLAAGSFEKRTALTPDACAWAVGVLATALRFDIARSAPPPSPPPGSQGPGFDTARPVSDGQQARAPRPAPAPPRWDGPAPVPGVRPDQRHGLRLTAAVLTAVGAILIVWACALPDLYVPAGNGRTSFSIFNSGSAGGLWFAVEPAGVAVIGVAAALITILATRAARVPVLAAGVLVGFGIQTILLFAGYEYYVRSPDHAGPAGAVGILGGIVLLGAGLIAVASRPRSTASTGVPSAGRRHRAGRQL